MKAFQKIVVLLYKGKSFSSSPKFSFFGGYTGKLGVKKCRQMASDYSQKFVLIDVVNLPGHICFSSTCWCICAFGAVLKFFSLFWLADVLSEEAILKWYNEAHVAKGKSVFLEQMKAFVEWLKNAEEGKRHTFQITWHASSDSGWITNWCDRFIRCIYNSKCGVTLLVLLKSCSVWCHVWGSMFAQAKPFLFFFLESESEEEDAD